MQERNRTRNAGLPGPGSDPLFDGDDTPESGGPVTVTHGPYAEDLPVGEMTVGTVRTRFQDRMDIHPDAVALIDGGPVDDDTIVRTGSVLTFMRPSGEKGARRGGRACH